MRPVELAPATTAAICAMLVACGAPPVAAPSHETATVAPPAAETPAEPAVPAPATGIACGDTRCDEERPHCCSPMGEVLDTSEPRPEPYCVVDYTKCPGTAYSCKGRSDCPAGQYCVHDASVNTNYCDDDLTDALIMCREDAECDVLECGPSHPTCEYGKCDCAD